MSAMANRNNLPKAEAYTTDRQPVALGSETTQELAMRKRGEMVERSFAQTRMPIAAPMSARESVRQSDQRPQMQADDGRSDDRMGEAPNFGSIKRLCLVVSREMARPAHNGDRIDLQIWRVTIQSNMECKSKRRRFRSARIAAAKVARL